MLIPQAEFRVRLRILGELGLREIFRAIFTWILESFVEILFQGFWDVYRRRWGVGLGGRTPSPPPATLA